MLQKITETGRLSKIGNNGLVVGNLVAETCILVYLSHEPSSTYPRSNKTSYSRMLHGYWETEHQVPVSGSHAEGFRGHIWYRGRRN